MRREPMTRPNQQADNNARAVTERREMCLRPIDVGRSSSERDLALEITHTSCLDPPFQLVGPNANKGSGQDRRVRDSEDVRVSVGDVMTACERTYFSGSGGAAIVMRR